MSVGLTVSIGASSGLFTEYGYRVTIAVIAVTLCVSPLWIWLGRQVRTRYPEAPEAL